MTNRLDLTDEERACRCQGGGGLINPQWVTVSNWSGASDYKLVEGYVVRSWPPMTDAPFNHDLAWNGGDWYVIHDVGVVVSPDPKYYNLVSTKPEWESSPNLLGCETQGDKIPDHLRPVEGDRVSLFGFWILDCGHEPFYTEIHPIVGWAVHRNRPVRIPDDATFTFDLVTNTVTSTAGNNLYVPGIATDLWFNSDTGDNTGGGNNSLAQPARCNPNYAQCLAANPGHPEFCQRYLDADNNITQSPIQREYDFNIYLPKNPSDVFAEVGQHRPRAPLYVTMSNPHASDGPYPTITRTNETVNGVTYEYLRVHLDLRGYPFSTYSRRIEAAWVYPKADNWGLAQYRVALHKLDVYDDLDSKARWPGTDGDWILWLMLPSADQSWTRILDGFNNTHGTKTFDPPWETGSSDSVFHRPPLSIDPQRRLGSDILSFSPYVNFWMGGYEADEGFDDDPGRISSFFYNYTDSVATTVASHNGNFSASFTTTRIATLNNGTLSAAAAQLGRHYLITCTNRINNRNPIRDSIAPLDQMGILAEGVSGEPPWSPVDPLQLYGSGAALIGDVNKDGFPDMALGTRGTNVEAHIFLGGRNGFPPVPHAIASVALPENPGFSRGTFTGAGDLNGDGFPDLLIATPTYMSGGATNGAVFAFLRRATGRRREPGRQQRDLVRERRFSERAVWHFGGGGRPQPRRLQRHHCERALLSKLGGLQSPVGPRVRLSRLVERTARTAKSSRDSRVVRRQPALVRLLRRLGWRLEPRRLRRRDHWRATLHATGSERGRVLHLLRFLHRSGPQRNRVGRPGRQCTIRLRRRGRGRPGWRRL